jgi:hypothetical protein
MIGCLASMRVFLQLLDDSGLRIRHGTTVDVRLPWEAVERVAARRGSVATSRSVQVEHRDEGAVGHVAVLKQTRVVVKLRRPTPVALPGGAQEIVEARFYVDDARRFVAAARERLTHRRLAAWLRRGERFPSSRPHDTIRSAWMRIARTAGARHPRHEDVEVELADEREALQGSCAASVETRPWKAKRPVVLLGDWHRAQASGRPARTQRASRGSETRYPVATCSSGTISPRSESALAALRTAPPREPPWRRSEA